MPAQLTTPAHGTRHRYQLRRDPCRCDRCRHANTQYVRATRGLPTWVEVELPMEVEQ